jgi:hypothetical protein
MDWTSAPYGTLLPAQLADAYAAFEKKKTFTVV